MYFVKFIINFLFITILVVSSVYSSTFITLENKHPDHPNKCWSEETNRAYDFGEIHQPNNSCVRMTCRSDYRFDGATCGISVVNIPNCVEVEPDLTKPYPRCCDKYRCEDGKGGFFTV